MTTLFTAPFNTSADLAYFAEQGSNFVMTPGASSGYLASSGSASVTNSRAKFVLQDVYAVRADQEITFRYYQGNSSASWVGLKTNFPSPPTGGTSSDATKDSPIYTGGQGVFIGLNGTNLVINGVQVATNLPQAATTNTWKNVRVKIENNTLYYRIWADGAGEPGTWNYTFDLSSYTIADGRSTLWVRRTSTSSAPVARFDDIVVSDIPAFLEATVNATPMTASATAPTATFSQTSTQSATPMTATGSMEPAVASTIRNPTYTATPITASATMPTATVSTQRNVTVNATPMTATATSPTALGQIAVTAQPTDDYGFDQFTSVNNTDVLYINGLSTSGGSAIYRTVLKYTGPGLGSVTDFATLTLTTRAAGGGGMNSLTVYPILADWTGRPGTKASYTLGTPITITTNVGNNLPQTFNLVGLFDEGQVYGFMLEGDAGGDFRYFQSNEGSNPPVFNIKYHSEISDAVVSALPMEATAEMPDASVTLVTDVNTLAEPFTGDATMPDALGVVDRDVEILAEVMDAYAEMPGGEFSLPATYEATPMFATGESPDATTSTTIGVNYVASPMKGTARFVTISQVNDTPIEGEAVNDNYFNRVQAKNPSYWVRMLSPTSPLNNYVSGQPVVDVRGVVTLGQLDGPDGRPSINFGGGGYLEQREPSGTNQDENVPYLGTNWSGDLPHTLEFAIRTTKSNQFIMAGSDSLVDIQTGVVSDANIASEINLLGGKINFKHYRSFVPTGTREVRSEETTLATGTRVINDGEWHTIVVRHAKSPVRDEYGFEVWIDGTLEFRRLLNAGWAAGFPDYIGGRGTYMSGVTLPVLPNSRMFEGDMGEIVFYPMLNLPKDDIERNRYAFMGWVPVEAQPMEADASMPDASGRGNKKKALYLYFTGQDEVFNRGLGGANPNGDNTSYDPHPGLAADSYFATLAPRVNEEVGDLMGFKVFTKSARVNYNNGVTAYRDQITDEQSLIDLTRDVNLDDYDVIMFKDWPDESLERDWLEANYPGQLDKLIGQLQDANEAGMELLITNPRMAIDLGFVDTIEYAPALTEIKVNQAQGPNALGSYDYGSAVKFPWNIITTDNLANGAVFAAGVGEPQDLSESTLGNKAFYYYDTNKNNKYRVRALVPGLTDIPAYMLEDAVFHIDADIQGWQGVAYKYLNAMDGLKIGDEFIFWGSSVIDPEFLDMIENRYNRFAGAWSTPPGAVNVGTVVTTFADKLWNEKSIVDNPYKNHVTSIAVEIGEKLNGRTIGGRVFINFTEQPNQGIGWPKQVLPGQDMVNYPDIKWPYGYGGTSGVDGTGNGETAQQQTWDYSWTRTTLTTTQSGTQKTVVEVQLPDGSFAQIKAGDNGDEARLQMVRSSQLFPVVGLPGAEMISRGLIWLGEAPVLEAGDVVVRAEPMTASGTMTTATPVVQTSVRVQATSMIAKAVMPEAEEAKTGDAEYLAVPMTAHGTFSQGGDTEYKADAMTASATMPDVVLRASGESITLRLPRQKRITLRMEAR